MDIGVEVINKFAITSAFYLIASKFMSQGWLPRLALFASLFVTQMIFVLYPSNLGAVDFLICIVVISLFINVKLKNYFKSFDIAISILITFIVFIDILGSSMLLGLPDIFNRSSVAFNLIMQVCIVTLAFFLRKHKDYFFNFSNDEKILLFGLAFKTLLFTLIMFGLPVLYRIDKLGNYIFLVSTWLSLIIIAIGFFAAKYVAKRTSELEAINRKGSIELAGQLIKSENINRQYDEIIKYKHFFASVYRSIVGYITSNDMQGLKKYYEEHIAPINEQLNKEVQEYEQIKYIHLSLIKSRIIELINTVSHMPHVALYILIDNIIDTVAMKEIDLFTVLNICIDNAVEEVSSQEKGEISIWMTKSHEGFSFKITNTLNGYDSTPKPQNTHKGIEIILKINMAYPNMSLFTQVEYGLYIKSVNVSNS